MNRREFVKTTAAASAGLTLLPRGAGAEGRETPNLVFVFPDQFRAQAMGFMKADPTMTPHIDRFASESVVFTNAVSNFPLCSPYRAMLMTGRWPYSTGITSNCNSSTPNIYLRETEECFSDVLAGAGYSVGYIGKWHLDTPQGVPVAEDWRKAVWDAYNPPGPRRHHFTFWHAYGCSNDHTHPHYWIGDASKDEKTFFDEYSPIHEANVAIDYIMNKDGEYRDSDKPFALFVAMNPPHPPFDKVPDRYRALYGDKTAKELLNRPNVDLSGKGEPASKSVRDYFAAVSGVDEAFGRILKGIEEAGLEESTVVVFSADHGEMMGSHARMGKVTFYEESFRIPLLIRYPGEIRPRQDSLHINVPDIMPTLLGLMGLADRVPSQVEGTDYSAALRGKDILRPGSSFYLIPVESKDAGTRGVRTDRYTFIVTKRKAGRVTWLFDNRSDPYQMTNIASGNPELVEELTEELNGWLHRTSDPWGSI